MSEHETAHVDFGEVAGETVHESVEHEREITIADDLDPTAAEPYAPVDEGAVDPETIEDDNEGTAEPSRGLPEDTEWTPPAGDQVVNAITAAVRR